MSTAVERAPASALAGSEPVGIAGIGLGVLAFWLALPPVHSRTVALPAVVGAAAIACGAWAVAGGRRRLGWAAVAAGVIGIAGAVLATHASVSHLQAVITWSTILAATLVFATPLTYAAIGGMFSERSGVVNIGLEGMMLMGAFFGAYGADKTGSWVAGVLIGMASGAALALVHAFFAIHLRADQIVGGTAVNFLALGITGYLYVDIYGNNGTPDNLPAIPDVHLGWLGSIPPHSLGSFLDEVLGSQNLMVWLSFVLLVVAYIVMFRTPLGLHIRSVGEHPRAADTVGISVYGVRYASVVTSGALAALGGAYLSIGFVNSFTENMTAGRGFIALAALIFGKWRPFGAFAAALLFGFSSAFAPQLQNVDAWSTYGTLFEALPYVLTLIAVAGVIGRSIPPAAIGRPYQKQ
ncbi:MAG: ABC transporter permease [Actinobacteria bacterium]|nr:MAG: ABC transporter permease [Actinomycetota bacterium]